MNATLTNLIDNLKNRLRILWYGRDTRCAMCDFYGDEEDDESASVDHPPAEARDRLYEPKAVTQ